MEEILDSKTRENDSGRNMRKNSAASVNMHRNPSLRKNSGVDSLRRAFMNLSKGTSRLLLRYNLSIFISWCKRL